MRKITKLVTHVLVATGALLAIVQGGLVRAQASKQTGKIVITIRVPADAILMIEDHKTESTGDVRIFETPPLAMGQHYGYTLKAKSGGKEVVRKIHLAHGMDNSFDLRAEFLPGAPEQVHPKQFSASAKGGGDMFYGAAIWGVSLRTLEQAMDTAPVDFKRSPIKEEGQAETSNAATAIDILLEPYATMIKHAEAANKLLLKNFPKGFALGKTHQPHISCLQRFVKTADLDKVYDAVGKVLAEEKPTSWKLKAYKYAYLPWNDNYLAALVIEPTEEFLRYQMKLVSAIAPFTLKTGTAAAFVTTKEEPDINQATIEWVEKFVPDQTGKKFIPHVTIGMASEQFLKKLVTEKFESFTFTPAGVSLYHLGNFGTARTKLKGW